MKRFIIVLALCISPFIILADAFDEYQSTGNPYWHYFDYQVSYPDGGTNTGKIKVCASNAIVAVSTGRALLTEKYGKCSVKLAIKARGEACPEERTGEIYY